MIKITIAKVRSVRDGWEEAFAKYVQEGEDSHALPDLMDVETLDSE